MGPKVVFDGSFSKEDGSSYLGDVNVSAFHLLPSDENLNQLMPGMLYAQTLSNNEAFLETFGMLNVELRGSSGEKLQITEGHTAGIEMVIDDSQIASAPATIPLWHFDQQKGYWIEEGSVSKVGNKYIGSVSHFSWWNCDAPFEVVTLQATIKDNDGMPIAYAGVRIIISDSGFGTLSYTDANGQVSGMVPANEGLTLQVISAGNCSGNVIHSQNIGPFTTDTTLPDIVVTLQASDVTTVSGMLNDCDNQAVTNGYVVLSYADGPQVVVPVSNGTFSANLIVCAGVSTLDIEGVDFGALESYEQTGISISFPTTDIGTIATCTQITGELNYQIDSGPITTLTDNIEARIVGNELRILCGNQTLDFFNATTTTGQFYDITTVHGYALTSGYTTDSSNFVITINELGAVGELVKMNFEGSVIADGQQKFLFGDVEAIRVE